MDFDAPVPDDDELRALLAELTRQSRTVDIDNRRTAFERLYELAYSVGPKVASAIPTLIEGLLDADPTVGEKAVWALHYCNPDSIEPLIECLSYPKAFVRERAAHALGNIGDPAQVAVPSLIKLLDDEDQAVRSRSAWAIGLTHDTAPETIEALARTVARGTVEDKASALHALGNIAQALDTPSALAAHEPLILAGLNHADDDVRWSALFVVKSLGMAHQSEVELLSKLMQHEQSERVLGAILSRLADLAPVADLSGLLPTITASLIESQPHAARACEILSKMQPPPREAIAPLLRALEINELVLPAVKALWKIDKRSEPLLAAVERVFDDDVEPACDVICELGPVAAPLLPKLVSALSEDDWDIQWAAADALGAVASPDPHVTGALLEALGHRSPIVRSASARALAKTGNAVIPQLRSLLRDQKDGRSALAAYSLEEMGPLAADALPDLRAGMRGPSCATSSRCAIAVAHIGGDAETVPYLISIVRNDDLNAPRRDAACALGHLGPIASDAIEALEALIGDDDFDVHQAAEDALAAIRAPSH